MSILNEANDLASQLVYGRHYPYRLIFVKGDSTAVFTAEEETHDEWSDVASAVHALLSHGYRLGCDMDVSWNGRYDTDGDPLPGGPGNYLPCRKPVSVNFDGRHLCEKHDHTDYKAKWLAAQQGPCNVEEL